MCRRINQGLIASECFRELDAQLKFREIIKNADKEAEIAYVKALRADMEKYEEEMKQKAEKQLEKKRNYSVALKKQIEEVEKATKEEETKEFEAQKQDQINMAKYLSDAKEFEMQKLLTKKQKLNQFFKDAIEEKKQLNLKLKHEDAFEDRAIEIYKQAKARIAKAYKEVKLNENKERERRADFTAEKFRTLTQSKGDIEERNYKKAVEEQEAQFQEKEKNRKEHALRLKKEIHDFKKETENAKSKFLQEEKDWKTWELMQRFKRAEYDKELDAEERKRARDKKMEYAKSLKKYISEREVTREQEKLAEDKAMDMTEIINKENKKVLDYAEEVLNESKDVRPLLPILKAVDDCKREMGLLPLKKREATIAEAKRKKRRIPRVCTKFVPEDKICYLN
nr:PREDICTED: stress response protein NST1-like [Megachile rotundata]